MYYYIRVNKNYERHAQNFNYQTLAEEIIIAVLVMSVVVGYHITTGGQEGVQAKA